MLPAATTMERVQDHDTTQALDPSDIWTALFEYTVPREKVTMALMDRKKGDTTSRDAWHEAISLTQDDHYSDVIFYDYKRHLTQGIAGVLNTAEQSDCYSADALGLEPKMVTFHKHHSIEDWIRVSEEQKALILGREGMITHLVNLLVSAPLPKTSFSSVASHALWSIFNPYLQLGENKLQASLLAQMEENNLRSSLLARLRKWCQTPEENRWPDATWPADKAFSEAEAFVSNLPGSALPELRMGMVEDGEINFSWDTEEIEIDLGFYGTRPCSYYAHDKSNNRDLFGEDFIPSDGLPSDLSVFFMS